jgi:hypothetical protein
MKIEFYPTAAVGREFPPIPVKKAIPEWYKNVPNELGPFTATWFSGEGGFRVTNATVKQCVPVLDYLTSGYVIRNQAETLVSVQEDDGQQGFFWRSASHDKNSVGHHGHAQCPVHIEGQKKTYIKLRGGYVVKTPPGYSCLFYQSPYSLNDKFHLFPAIVDTDTFDGEILFPGYMLKGAGDFMLEAGVPLVTAFPFKRDNWTHEVMTEVLDDTNSKIAPKEQSYLSKVYKRFFHKPKEYK